MKNRLATTAIIALATVLASLVASAQTQTRTANSPPTFTPEREAAALSFVKRHHGDLLEVLDRLKSAKPKAYEQAVSELFQTSENLANQAVRDPKRHQTSLDLWKIKSRVDLLSARLAGPHEPRMVDELRRALLDQADLEIRRQKAELESLENQVRKVRDRVDRLERERDQTVAAKLKRLVDRGRKPRPSAKTKP